MKDQEDTGALGGIERVNWRFLIQRDLWSPAGKAHGTRLTPEQGDIPR
jgi:hypothetical protein